MFISFSHLTFIIFLFTTHLFADSYVVFVKGNAFIENESKTKITKGMEVLEQDEIVTSDNSLVVLKIEGHSIHKIGPNSRLKVSALPVTFEQSSYLQVPASFILKAGKILSDVIKKSDNESIQIKAKDSVMGVRGTKFLVEKNSDDSVALMIQEGSIEVSNATNKDLVESNELLVIDKTNRFHSLAKVDSKTQANWDINSAYDITNQNLGEKFLKQKPNYERNEARWKKFKSERAIRINKWKKETKPLIKSLVKMRKERRNREIESFDKVNDLRRNRVLQKKNSDMNHKSKQINDYSNNEMRRQNMLERRRLRNHKKANEQTPVIPPPSPGGV